MQDGNSGRGSGAGCILTGIVLILTGGLILFVVYGCSELAAGDPDDPEHGRQVLSEMFHGFLAGTVLAGLSLLLGLIAVTFGIRRGCSGGPGASHDR